MKRLPSFTLIELLLVIALIGILVAATAPVGSSVLTRNNQNTTTDQVLGTIRKAQSYAMDKKLYEYWGVCTDASKIRLFGGDQFATCTSNSFQEDYTIPSVVSVTGMNETLFNGRGEPIPSNGLSSISISSDLDSSTISVNSVGGINVN